MLLVIKRIFLARNYAKRWTYTDNVTQCNQYPTDRWLKKAHYVKHSFNFQHCFYIILYVPHVKVYFTLCCCRISDNKHYGLFVFTLSYMYPILKCILPRAAAVYLTTNTMAYLFLHYLCVPHVKVCFASCCWCV